MNDDVVDVNSMKELVKRMHWDTFVPFKKKLKHRALSDIKESIEELKAYKARLSPITKAQKEIKK